MIIVRVCLTSTSLEYCQAKGISQSVSRISHREGLSNAATQSRDSARKNHLELDRCVIQQQQKLPLRFHAPI